MMRIAIILLIPFIIINTAACSLLDSNNDEPDIPGQIVFAANDSAGTSQIFSMQANGQDIKQLTHFDGAGEAFTPAWSPDGSQIIFSSFKQGTSVGPALWLMDANGSNQRVLYDPDPDDTQPGSFPLPGRNARWSPDGSKIAFDLCLNCQISTNIVIYVFDLETKQLNRLTEEPNGYQSSQPTWSPDGTRIAFVANRDYIDADTLRFRRDLYVMDADGSNQQRLTEEGYATRPEWSPDGDLIAYESINQNNVVLLHKRSSGETKKIEETGFKFTGNPIWNNQDSQLIIFGRETKESQSKLRLFNIKNDSFKISQTVILDEKATGKNYDWHITN